MVNTIQMTQTGYDELAKELEELKTTKRSEIAEKIKIARGYGDLSENSEYDAAKNEQAEIEARIAVLEEQLKHVTIVDTDSLSLDVVGVGSKVKVLDKDMEEEGEYLIVGAMEVGHEMNTISDQSPVGHALIGHKKGETVVVEAPGGAFGPQAAERLVACREGELERSSSLPGSARFSRDGRFREGISLKTR